MTDLPLIVGESSKQAPASEQILVPEEPSDSASAMVNLCERLEARNHMLVHEQCVLVDDVHELVLIAGGLMDTVEAQLAAAATLGVEHAVSVADLALQLADSDARMTSLRHEVKVEREESAMDLFCQDEALAESETLCQELQAHLGKVTKQLAMRDADVASLSWRMEVDVKTAASMAIEHEGLLADLSLQLAQRDTKMTSFRQSVEEEREQALTLFNLQDEAFAETAALSEKLQSQVSKVTKELAARDTQVASLKLRLSAGCQQAASLSVEREVLLADLTVQLADHDAQMASFRKFVEEEREEAARVLYGQDEALAEAETLADELQTQVAEVNEQLTARNARVASLERRLQVDSEASASSVRELEGLLENFTLQITEEGAQAASFPNGASLAAVEDKWAAMAGVLVHVDPVGRSVSFVERLTPLQQGEANAVAIISPRVNTSRADTATEGCGGHDDAWEVMSWEALAQLCCGGTQCDSPKILSWAPATPRQVLPSRHGWEDSSSVERDD
jgi:uncharacterized protein with ACT and thioredoxin-like domain